MGSRTPRPRCPATARVVKRALAGIAFAAALTLTAGAALPQCSGIGGSNNAFKDGTVGVPGLFVNVLKPPYLPIMHAASEVKTIHTPQSFELQAFLWQWKSSKDGYVIVRSWKRFKKELPAPGKEKTFRFPDLRLGGPSDKQDDLLLCVQGQYFLQFHIFGDSSTGDRYDVHAYFPYDTRRGKQKYEHAPLHKQAWQVTCDKTGQVPNPKGTSAPLLILGTSGWRFTP